MSLPAALVIRRARIPGMPQLQDIAFDRVGRIAAIEPDLATQAQVIDAGGRLAVPGFVETHIHLDKACLLGRCGCGGNSAQGTTGGLAASIRAVSQMKAAFTKEDVYARGARVLEAAIAKGTTRMRTHVEVDPRIGLRGFEAVKALKRDYAWALDLSLCVFPQEGLTNDPGTLDLLVAALEDGADALGGCPYTDTAPHQQIARLFDLAARFDVDLDFHLDFDLDPSWSHLEAVCRQTEAHHYGGRVAAGHVTKLSAVAPDVFAATAARLAQVGVAITVLPATDLYLMGREATHAVPRGVTPAHRLAEQGVVCSIATNNVLNPFTPFGDGSLLRMANLYANVAQVPPEGFAACLDLVTYAPARLLRLPDYGFAPGHAADLVLLDAESETDAVARIAQPVMGFKRGRRTFSHAPAVLDRPDRPAP